VLKWAFEGKLTEKWRNTHQDSLEDADTLLEQIKAERKRHYQQQLEDWKQALKEWENNGKETKKPTKPQQPKDLPPLTKEELSNLPSLPNGWMWVKLEDITNITGGIAKNSKRNALSIKLPYLRVANVYANFLDLNEVYEIGLRQEEVEKFLLVKNDLLIIEGNGSIDQIGRVAIWNDKINPCVHQNHVIKARPHTNTNPLFSLYFLLSHQGRKFIKKQAGSTSGLYTLSLSKVRNLNIPFCSLQEQTKIVQEIESRLSVCDQLEATLTENLDKAEALRQSILKRAFEGKLVL
jgi:type I restriction enzyme S subunit